MLKNGDFVWYNLLASGRKWMGRIDHMNPHALDGSEVVISSLHNPESMIFRLPHEVSVATEGEVVLWKLENL